MPLAHSALTSKDLRFCASVSSFEETKRDETLVGLLELKGLAMVGRVEYARTYGNQSMQFAKLVSQKTPMQRRGHIDDGSHFSTFFRHGRSMTFKCCCHAVWCDLQQRHAMRGCKSEKKASSRA